MAVGSVRRRTNNPDAMRGRLLDSAAALFQAHGYHATTMQDILQTSGISGGATYHYFPTKKAFALAVIRERVAVAVDQTWIQPVLAAPSALEGILGVFSKIQDDLEARGAVQGCPLNNLALELSLADPTFRAEIQRIFADWRHAIARKLRADPPAGDHKNLDPDDAAIFVVASYSGAMTLAKADQSSEALKVCARQLAAAIGPSNRE